MNDDEFDAKAVVDAVMATNGINFDRPRPRPLQRVRNHEVLRSGAGAAREPEGVLTEITYSGRSRFSAARVADQVLEDRYITTEVKR
jgi:hypothetical protein